MPADRLINPFPTLSTQSVAVSHLLTAPSPTPEAFADATWLDVAPLFDALEQALLSPATVPAWLAAWSGLEEALDEAGTRAMIAYTADTADAAKEAAHLRWSAEIFPRMHERQVRLAQRLLDSGYTAAELETTLARMRTDAELFREENVALFSALEELSAAYQKLTGGLLVDWAGERKTIPQLQPYLKSREREVRERAFRAAAGAYLACRDELAALFDKMLALRTRVARHAGVADYQAYTFRAKYRDYSPADCARFHRAVEETVVPAVERLFAYRRERLGVPRLRPWDLAVELDHAEPLRPFDDTATLIRGAEHVFTRVDPAFGEQFAQMRRETLLDLDSRPGKAPGAYCTELARRGVPFIFMNAVGVSDDVSTLLHEAGHAFHDFAKRRQPLVWQRAVGSEAAELASMSMELLASRFLARPDGLYSDGEARAARIEHLEDVLLSLAHIASVDAFQSWIYTSGQGHDAAARDAAWLEIRARFERGVDWSGLEAERASRWYRQLHIFEYPFYYIEYGIAQLGALQIWRASLRDHAGAVARYRAALALGGTKRLPALYAAAGARLVFDAEPMAELIALVEREIATLRGA